MCLRTGSLSDLWWCCCFRLYAHSCPILILPRLTNRIRWTFLSKLINTQRCSLNLSLVKAYFGWRSLIYSGSYNLLNIHSTHYFSLNHFLSNLLFCQQNIHHQPQLYQILMWMRSARLSYNLVTLFESMPCLKFEIPKNISLIYLSQKHLNPLLHPH